MKKTLKRAISFILVMAFLIPFPAYAADYDLSEGSVTVTGGSEGQTVKHGEKDAVKDSDPVVKQSDPNKSNTVTVDGTNGAASVTIKDVNIDTGSSGDAGIVTKGDATIVVDGNNAVHSENTAIDATGNLTILGKDTTEKEENTLAADGGNTGIKVNENDPDSGSEYVGGVLNIGPDVTVTAAGGSIGADADVFVDGGNLNAYGEIYGDRTTDGIGVNGDLTVTNGAAAVYGQDIGINGNLTVGTGETGTAAQEPSAYVEVHSPRARYNNKKTVKDTGKVKQVADTYVPDSNGVMQYSMQKNSYNGSRPTFDIQGYYDGALCGTTYRDCGYETFLRIGDTVTYVQDFTGTVKMDNGLKVKIDLVPQKNGQLLQIVYTVINDSEDTVTFDLGSGADVQIKGVDSAKIASLEGNTGFQMLEKNSVTEGAAFAFFGKGYDGVTSVDGFWYGHWSDEWSSNKQSTVFKTEPSSYASDSGYDSAASWCWLDKEIAAGQTQTFTVLLGVGNAEELKDAAGDNTLVPDDDTDTDTDTDTEVTEKDTKPAAGDTQPSQLDIKLDTVTEVIDLISGTQDGKSMEKLEVNVELPSGKSLPSGADIIVRKVETHAENTVEDLNKDNVGLAFTVAYIRDGKVKSLPGSVKLSIPAPEGDVTGYTLVFVKQNGKQVEIPYELVDGNIVFHTEHNGLYMLIKK